MSKYEQLRRYLNDTAWAINDALELMEGPDVRERALRTLKALQNDLFVLESLLEAYKKL